MIEIELSTSMYILGEVTKGNKPTFLKFEVWVRIEDTDTEITALMTQQQLKDLQLTWLWERDLSEVQTPASLEDVLMDQADSANDELKLDGH